MYFSAELLGNSEFNPDPGEISKYKWLALSEIKKHSNKEGSLNDLFKRNPGLKI